LYKGYSKFANIVYTGELQKRLDVEETPIVAVAVHPGVVNTFADRLPPAIRSIGTFIMKWFFTHPDEGAYTTILAAASPDVRTRPEKYKGAYLVPVGRIFKLGKTARNPELGPELWRTTEEFLATIGLEV
jgi:NAD(P)-dependent dehydrogenase (short-subunit alcohol dehydrogenase family)